MRQALSVGGVLATLGLALIGCSPKPPFVATDEPWRKSDEVACVQAGFVRETPHIVARAALGGPSYCGALRPFQVSGLMGGRVQFSPSATLRCPMIPALERWMSEVVQPAARFHFGMRVVEIKVLASYSCRPRNGIFGAKLSEHGHANAIDISSFRLESGQWVAVKTGWRGAAAEAGFLRAVHDGGCRYFTTVLGPNADAYHHDHFHLDLARHGREGTYRVCR
jgi:hypothetical protein